MELLKQLITSNIATAGYPAIIALMGLESANIPVPSELVMPFAGFLVAQGHLNIHLVALAGAVGCLIGSVLSYLLGKHLGRAFIEQHGHRVMISQKQLELADKWMQSYGNATAFFSRLLPVVRTFISLPMGVARAPFLPFIVLTFIGSWIWSYVLAYVGFVLGDHWEALAPIWHRFDIVIVAVILVTVIGGAYHHMRPSKKGS